MMDNFIWRSFVLSCCYDYFQYYVVLSAPVAAAQPDGCGQLLLMWYFAEQGSERKHQ